MRTHRIFFIKFVLLLFSLIWLNVAPVFALNILLVNDDGYEAEGINILFAALDEAGHDVTMVAPKVDQSDKGTAMLIQSGPLTEYGGTIELVNIDTGKWYLNGTPVDCVAAATNIVMAANPPDLIISGPNRGENVGYMAAYSGTVGAAIRGIHGGYPAIAVSVGMDWKTYLADRSMVLTTQAYPEAGRFVVDLIEQLTSNISPQQKLLPEGTGLNINYPVMLPAGKENPIGIRETEIDGYITFGMVYGFNTSSKDSVLPGMWPSFDNNFKAGETASKRSEGRLFQEGYITVSVIDGDMNSSENKKVFQRLNIKGLNIEE